VRSGEFSVNFLIFPPKFSPIISKRLKGLCSQAATILEERGNELLVSSKGRMEKEEVDDTYPKKYHHHFNGKTVLAYELLSINDLLEELKELHDQNKPQHVKKGHETAG
jgi:hypothetical protein